jgi:hypothetical protein
VLTEPIEQKASLTSWLLLPEDFADQTLDHFSFRLGQTLHLAERRLLRISQ